MDQTLFIVGINHRTAAVAMRERLAFAEDEIVLIVPAGHALARRRKFLPEWLAPEVLIVRESGSATRQIVEAQGGRVGVTSKVGQGSIFWAVLPRRHSIPDNHGATHS